MSANPILSCGVAGVGYLGQHHARIYHTLKQTHLTGVYDVNRKRAKEIADLYGTRVFETIEELGEACEAVSVVVPTDKHAPVALALLDKGCHLLIEKPITPSLAEAEAIMEKARSRDLIVQVGHIEHYNPVMGFLEKKVTDPRFITCDRLAPFKKRGIEVGVVLDLMIHDIGVILQLVRSPIARIDSVGVKVLTKTEDIANARLTFENGCVANINTSRVSLKAVREIRVFQTNTYLSLNFAEQRGHLIRKGKLGLSKKDIPIEKGEPLMLELASFADAVGRRSQPKVDAQLGTNALEIAIRITEQIQQNL